jgi:hypothetical protein
MLTLEIATLALPVLVMVKLCEAVVPSVTEPKLRLEGVRLNVLLAATPVPLTATFTGEPVLLEMPMLPEAAPAAVGANWTLTEAV